jgi:hypothetical protein
MNYEDTSTEDLERELTRRKLLEGRFVYLTTSDNDTFDLQMTIKNNYLVLIANSVRYSVGSKSAAFQLLKLAIDILE